MLGLKKEDDEIKIKNQTNLGSSLETPEGKYLNMKSLELFQEAVLVARGNKKVLRKLADMELKNEKFL